MKVTKLILASILMLASLSANAQGIKAYLKDGTLLDYEITDISQVTIIELADGTRGFEILDANGNTVQYPLTVLTGVRCQDKSGFYFGHKAVDLGLPSGTLWAEYNVGASKPEEFGAYYFWGGTEDAKNGVLPFADYDHYSKYTMKGAYMDCLTELLPDDDVAHVKWGNDWCIPTMTQKRELLKYTTHVQETLNGVEGWRFYSTLNGNSLFFPASGIFSRSSKKVERIGEQTNIWTSTLYKSDDTYAYVMCDRMNGTMLDGAGFDMDPQSEAFNLSMPRARGIPVRPVIGIAVEKQKALTSAYPNDVASVSAVSMQLISFIRPGSISGTVSYGVCYSETQSTPTISNSNVAYGTLNQAKCVTDLKGLKPNTSYNIRYFLTINGETEYTDSYSRETGSEQDMVTTGNVMNSTTTTATIRSGYNLENAVYDNVEKWVCYGLTANPTIDGDKAAASGNGVSCIAELKGLTPNATYHYRACMKIDGQILYGNDLTFVAEDYGTPMYVDLGLPSGLLWATMNVGATSPEEKGDYFAWGEVTPRTQFDGSIYYYMNSKQNDSANNNMTKYNKTDGKNKLLPEDDAATVNWGSVWRTPTKQEGTELIDNCTFEKATLNGVDCIKCIGPNGNCIYFPRCGYYSSNNFYPTNTIVWTASLRFQYAPYNTNYSLAESLLLDDVHHELATESRTSGLNVRPVRDK